MRKIILPILLFMFIIQSCNLPNMATQVEPPSTPTATTIPIIPTETPSPLPIPTETVPPSQTPSPSVTPTITITPTITETPGPSVTPTFSFPTVTVNKQAHCRYGPNIAYLHAADLYIGDVGTVRGRFQLSKWLLIKFDKLGYFCWVAPSVVDVVGDINTILFSEVYLPGPSVLYKAPGNVTAVRQGKKVTITWDTVPMTKDDDRGYFLDLFVCQGKAYLWYPVALENRDRTSFTIKDEAGCPAPSGGNLYAVEKHGYTKSTEINWPVAP